MADTPAKTAAAAKPAGGESNKGQAVANFMVPIAAAWLLAVGGLLAWHEETSELIEKAGQLAVAAAGATAFLTVILSAIQDALPVRFKQWLIFPRGRQANPSYRAFTEAMLGKAERRNYAPANLAALRDDPELQNETWQKAYEKNRGHAAVAHFAQRTIAWRDTVPLLILLTAATPALAWALGCPPPIRGWELLTWAAAILLVICWLGARHAATGLVVTIVKLIADEPAPAPPPPAAPKAARKARP